MPEQFLRKNPWRMDLRGHPGKLLARLVGASPNAANAIKHNRLIPGKVDLYQVTLLFMLARQYNTEEGVIVDFGAMYGWSASMLSSGCPNGTIHTLEPDKNRRMRAKAYLSKYGHVNVNVWDRTSTAFQNEVRRRQVEVDMVFVDGDHHHCEPDMEWWGLLKKGGIMVFHDYTKKYPSVMQSVDRLVKALGKKQPDIRIINNQNKQGMVGVYKSTV